MCTLAVSVLILFGFAETGRWSTGRAADHHNINIWMKKYCYFAPLSAQYNNCVFFCFAFKKCKKHLAVAWRVWVLSVLCVARAQRCVPCRCCRPHSQYIYFSCSCLISTALKRANCLIDAPYPVTPWPLAANQSTNNQQSIANLNCIWS